MDYYQLLLEALKQRQGNIDDVVALFKTIRPKDPKYPGSFYASHSDMGSSRYGIPSNRTGTQTQHTLERKSSVTLFMDPQSAKRFENLVDDASIGTKLEPVFSDADKKMSHVQVVSTENSPARGYKVGQVIDTIPISRFPKVGFIPMEIGPSGFTSPIDYSSITDRYIHKGHPVVEVHPRPARLAGKAGIAAALAGGAGAASAGEYRQAAADIAESLLPLGMTPSTLAPGTLTPEQRAASDEAYRRKRAQEQEAKMRAQALLRSGVPMPEEYRQGGRVRMI